MNRRAAARVVLVVGGSDSSGGAGIQADVRTLESFGVSTATAVTAVTVQTGAAVRAVRRIPPAMVVDQMRAAVEVQPVRAVKSGMLGSPATVRAVAGFVAKLDVPYVLDPVAFATGGACLGGPGVVRAVRERLVPLARVVTANIFEAAALADIEVFDEASMVAAAREIVALGAQAAVVKGGHRDGRPVDVAFDGRRVHRFAGGIRYGRDLHGSGCAYASAVAAGLALGRTLPASLRDARAHVRALLREAWKTADGGWLRRPPGAAAIASRHSTKRSSRRVR